MGSRKVNTEGIDEELLLASIGRRTQDGTLPKFKNIYFKRGLYAC